MTIGEAEAQLAALQTREGSAAEAYDAGRIALDAANAKAASASAAVATESAKLAAMQRGIASFAVESYTGGMLSPLDSLLSGGEPQVILDRAGALEEIARTHADQVRAIRAQQITLTGAQLVATSEQRSATNALQQLGAAKAAIDGIIAQEQRVLDHLQAQQRQALLADQARQQEAARIAARAAIARLAAMPRVAPPAPSAVVAAAPVATPIIAPSNPAPVAAPSNPAPVAASSSPAPVAASSSPAPVAAGGNAAQVAEQAALSQQGKPYVYGAAGPDAYDCSGLVMWAYARAGVSLPHNAAAQYGYGTHVSADQLQPGDIVFFEENGGIGHDGIYVGNGQMVDANHTGGWVGVRNLYPGLIGGTRL